MSRYNPKIPKIYSVLQQPNKENEAAVLINRTIFAIFAGLIVIYMRQILLVLLLLISATGFSQQYINKSKSDVKKKLDKSPVNLDGISTRITETNSSITRNLQGPGEISTDEVYLFDSSGKCSSEKIISNCDSCFDRLLKAVLDQKKYEWKLINANQYVSKFSAGLFLEMQGVNNIYSFTILRTNLDKKMYDFLMKNK